MATADQDNFTSTQKLIIEQHQSEFPENVNSDLNQLLLQSYDNHAQTVREHRERIWRSIDDSSDIMLKSVFDFGLNALRTSALIAGAALASVTGLLPGIEKVLGHSIPDEELRWIAIQFSIALVLSVVASGTAYITQFFYSKCQEHHNKIWDFPYITYQPKFYQKQNYGIAFHYITVLLCVLVYVFLGYGFSCLLITSNTVPQIAAIPLEQTMPDISLFTGITIGAVGGAFAGISVKVAGWLAEQVRVYRQKKQLYCWLQTNTSYQTGEKWRSTRSIASYNNLTEDRVRYICSIHKSIFLSTGEKEDLWGIYRSKED
ncbi:hypothetical protein [Pseudovibrio sp. SCP19]|uniref:hypothetical protein n=1 Tax=Pseudovibrio sp. SCP19 TaxID=3141374 RepID=UPI00333CA38A